jgi:uncharacterized protein involved in exopolysaccharide biosynthesis
MARRRNAIDPYVAMLKRSEWNAIVFGLFAIFLVILALFVAKQDYESTGALASVVDDVRQKVGLGLLCACALASIASFWLARRYVYFSTWPEKFEH